MDVNPAHVGSLVKELTKNGSPALLGMAGRLLGLGDGEQAALTQGKVPFWIWIALGVAGGAVVGVQIHKRWPEKTRIVGG